MIRRALTSYIAVMMLGSARLLAADGASTPKIDKPAERREHFQVSTKAGDLLYHGTVITRISEKLDEKIVLVRDEGFMDLIFRQTSDYETQTDMQRVSDVAGRAFVQHSWRNHLTATTRTDALAEVRENEALLMAPVIVNIETNGGKWEDMEANADDIVAQRRLRHEQRITMSQSLLEALERMRGTFFATRPGQTFLTLLVRHLLYEGDREMHRESSAVVVSNAAPHCDFDKAFGFACTDAQLKRIARAEKDGKLLTSY
jgi:hypothetical protein